ncbi:MAG: hypothetical protein QNI91_11410 [Arenicellales bacterium]|nr:hypothetical protein [Arenicellales bacterium]
MLVFWFWVLLLAALLFWPVSNLIWTLSVRRKQRKLKKELDEQEILAQKKRARFIAVLICLIFSLMFNLSQLGMPTNG